MMYSPEMLHRLQQLRSRIYAEFGVRIRLADPGLLDQLAELGPSSRDPFARKTIAEVMSMAGRPLLFKEEKKDVADAYKEITYRGRKLEVARDAATAPDVAPSTGTKRVYRGQVVNK